MGKRTKLLLGAIFLGVLTFDAAAEILERLDVDWFHYLGVTAAAGIALVCAVWFRRVRHDSYVEAMLTGIGFLLAFAPACALIAYLGSAFHGPRIDEGLAAVDHALGFDWSSFVAWSVLHPPLDDILAIVYVIAVWQVFVLVAFMGWRSEPDEIGRLCIAIAIAGIAASLFWIALPSFGAVTVYWIPRAIEARVHATVGNGYGRALIAMLAHGPGRIDTQAIKGLVGFPSFHAAEAIITSWYARRLKFLFPLFALFNLLNMMAMLIQGGHHLADVLGGIGLAALAIWLAAKLTAQRAPSGVLIREHELAEAGLRGPGV